MRDPAIKLFGKEIILPENGRMPVVSGDGSTGDCLKDEKVIITGDGELDTDKDSQRDNSLHSMEEDDPKTPQIIEEQGNEKPPDTGNETNLSDQKPLKKPDKIIPCPRCNSMDTKFCYFNNYNVNQPRHFCKGCQRYWTAGGTMRSVPVGAGRRKNKNSNTHCRQVMISEALMDIPKKVISFAKNDHNGSDCSSGSSNITTLNSIEGGMINGPKSNGFITQVPCLQGYPWPYPAIPNPRFCPPGYPIPVYPIPYWNCNVPWIPPPSGTNQIPSPLGKHSRNGDLIDKNNFQNNPETEVFEEPKSSDRTILIPKTLRIDDPDEAAKSSIWATLGIKNDPTNRKGLFKGFEPKDDEKKNYVPETPSSMKANPAAMSRSLNFLETA